MSTEDGDQGPLSPGQRDDLTRAGERARKILAAGRVATFNCWTLGVFGAVSLLYGLFSLTGLIVGICLAILAWNEFRGRELLRQFEPNGLKLLVRNQVGLMSLVVAYCLWSMYQTVANPNIEVARLEELAGLPGDFATDLTMIVYGLAIVLTLLFQGINARYYFTRTKLLADYLRETPRWIIDLQRSSLDVRG
jgi:hypothetical protein